MTAQNMAFHARGVTQLILAQSISGHVYGEQRMNSPLVGPAAELEHHRANLEQNLNDMPCGNTGSEYATRH